MGWLTKPHHIDTIIAPIGSIVAKLSQAVDAHREKAKKHRSLVDAHDAHALNADTEADRAARLVTKFSSLLE